MKVLKLLIVVAALGAGMTLSAKETKVNTEKSKVRWEGKKATGSGHYGFVDIKEGSLTFSDNKIEKATIVVDMSTIVNTDGKDGKPNARLVGHLKSEDFFGVDQHPTAKFILTGSSEFENNEAKVYGRLTIKGKTHPINFVAKKNGNTYTTKVMVDRSLYNVEYGLLDKAINKEFELDITLNVD